MSKSMTPQRVRDNFVQNLAENAYLNMCTTEEMNIVISALEKQMPKKPKYFHREYLKHKWEKKDDGRVDTFAWGYGYCNGPKCERCDAMPCKHCNPDYDSEKCIVDKYYCPNCNEEINEYDSPNGCKFCLQTLDWSDEE